MPDGQTLVLAEVTINLALLALEIVVMVAMLNKLRIFPRLFTWLWLAALVLPVVDIVVTAPLFPQVASSAFAPRSAAPSWSRYA